MHFILLTLLTCASLYGQYTERIKLYKEKLNLFQRMHTDYEPLVELTQSLIKGLNHNQSLDLLFVNLFEKNNRLKQNNRIALTSRNLPAMKKIAQEHELTELFMSLEYIEMQAAEKEKAIKDWVEYTAQKAVQKVLSK